MRTKTPVPIHTFWSENAWFGLPEQRLLKYNNGGGLSMLIAFSGHLLGLMVINAQ